MITEPKSDGLNNMSVKLTGWTNGGIQQKMLSNVKPVSSLGSKKDLQNTVDTAKDWGLTSIWTV